MVGADVKIETGWGWDINRPTLDESLNQGLSFCLEVLQVHI